VILDVVITVEGNFFRSLDKRPRKVPINAIHNKHNAMIIFFVLDTL